MIMLPIILVLVLAIVFFGSFSTAFSNITNGGTIEYDERTMQTYGNERYAEVFGSSDAYEENILIVFLVNDEYDGYYVYACVGDDLETDVKELFGNEYTEFGRTVVNTVNDEYYEFSLSSNLADVMTKMADEVTEISAGSEASDKDMELCGLTNRSSLSLNENTINKALSRFTEQTGISAAIVVDNTEAVFGKSLAIGDIFTVLFMIAGVALLVYLIYKAVRNRKNGKGNGQSGGQNGGYNQNYNSGGYNY